MSHKDNCSGNENGILGNSIHGTLIMIPSGDQVVFSAVKTSLGIRRKTESRIC